MRRYGTSKIPQGAWVVGKKKKTEKPAGVWVPGKKKTEKPAGVWVPGKRKT